MSRVGGNSLPCLIGAWVEAHGGRSVVHAGHFVVSPDGKPVILEDHHGQEKAEELWQTFGRLPLASWILGVDVVDALAKRGLAADLAVMVNDWQLLRDPTLQGTLAERRARFRSEHPELPAAYLRALATHELGIERVVEMQGGGMWISEYWLRRQFERRAVRSHDFLATSPNVVPSVKPHAGPMMVYRTVKGDVPLLSGGRAGCTGEVIEFLLRLYDKGYRSVVNIVPAECMEHVSNGCQVVTEHLGPTAMRMLNVAVPWRPLPEGVTWDHYVMSHFGADSSQGLQTAQWAGKGQEGEHAGKA